MELKYINSIIYNQLVVIHVLLLLLFGFQIQQSYATEMSPSIYINIGHSRSINKLKYSSNSQYIVSASIDGIIKLWDAKNGVLIRDYNGHWLRVNDVQFSPDSNYLAACGNNESIHIWEISSGKKVMTFKSNVASVIKCLNFSHDAKKLVFGTDNGYIGIWDYINKIMISEKQYLKNPKKEKEYYVDPILAISYSKDGHYLASGFVNGDLILHNIRTHEIQKLYHHNNPISDLCFNEDSKFLISASNDHTIVVFDLNTKKEKIKFFHHKNVTDIDINNDNQLISSSWDKTIKLWDIQKGLPVKTFLYELTFLPQSICFRPDKNKIAVGDSFGNIHILDKKSGTLVRKISANNTIIHSVDFTTKYLVCLYDDSINLWNNRSGELLNITRNINYEGTFTKTCLAPNHDDRIALGTNNGEIHIYNIESHTETTLNTDKLSELLYLCYSPDGKYLIAINRISNQSKNYINIWNVEKIESNLNPTHIELIDGFISCASFSSDSQYFSFAIKNQQIEIWHIEKWKKIKTIKTDFEITAIDYNPNNQQIATGNENQYVDIYNVKNGVKIDGYKGHTEPVKMIRYHPNGNFLVSCSQNSIVLWDSRKGLRNINHYCPNIHTLKFSPDGNKLILAGSLNSFSIYAIDPNKARFLYTKEKNYSILPFHQWLIWDEKTCCYMSSLQGDSFARIRLHNSENKSYPLTAYKNELQVNNWKFIADIPLSDISLILFASYQKVLWTALSAVFICIFILWIYYRKQKTKRIFYESSKEKKLLVLDLTEKEIPRIVRRISSIFAKEKFSVNALSIRPDHYSFKRFANSLYHLKHIIICLDQESHPFAEPLSQLIQSLTHQKILILQHGLTEMDWEQMDNVIFQFVDFDCIETVEGVIDRYLNEPEGIKSIEISNFHCINQKIVINDLSLDNRWIFFTGENGDGKSVFLQALAIGLVGIRNAARLLDEQQTSIKIKFHGEREDNIIRWDKSSKDYDNITSPLDNVCTFGPSRMVYNDEKEIPDPEESLLKQKGSLVNIENWLMISSGKKEKKRAKAIIQLFKTILIGVDDIRIQKKRLVFNEKGTLIHIDRLSSGNKSVFLMVGEILFRLFTNQPDTYDFKKLNGFVLIDEFDLHIHPSFLYDLPKMLSHAFPRIQFFCSTHSFIPLLGACEKSRFYRVKRKDMGTTTITDTQIDISRLHPNIILSSPLFDLGIETKPLEPDIKDALPCYVKSISIDHFQCINHIQLDFSESHMDPSHLKWIIFTGKNSTGKTAILKALTIALCGSRNADDQLPKSNKEETMINASVIKNGNALTEKELEPISWNVRKNFWTNQKNRNLFCASYGPSRLQLLEKPNEKTIFPEDHLLHQTGELYNIEDWLAVHNTKKERVEIICDLLKEIMPNIETIVFEKNQFLFTEKGHRATRKHIGSAHKSLLAMIGDLLVRFYSYQPDIIDPQEFFGIVIIDELDVHIQPQSQLSITSIMSKIFPKIQFICSTHSPVIAFGASKNSSFFGLVDRLVESSKKTDYKTFITPLTIDSDMSVNDIMASELFDCDEKVLSAIVKDFSNVFSGDDYSDLQEQLDIDQSLDEIALNISLSLNNKYMNEQVTHHESS